MLLNLLNSNPAEPLQRYSCMHWPNVGTKESLKVLRDAAARSGYTCTKENAVASYIALLSRLNESDAEQVRKEANKLY